MAAPASQRMPWSTIAATSLGFVVVQLDVTIVNVALPRIATDLATGVSALQWVVDAYTLTFAVLLLSAGSAGDRLGPARPFLGGFALFAIASLVCGLAPNGAVLIGARAIQGVAAAMLVPSSLALLSAACGNDTNLRARAVGVWTAAGGVAVAAGPVVGGLLLDRFGWRSVFLVNLPVCAIGLVLRHALPTLTPRVDARSFDLGGQLLSIIALGALVAGLIELRPLGLTHPIVIAAGAVALVAMIAFAIVESRAAAPMLPPKLIRRRGVLVPIAFGTVVNLSYYGIIFVLSLYLQQLLHYPARRAGLAFLPLTATFVAVNVLSGRLTARFGPRLPMTVGAVVGALGFILLRQLGGDSSFVAMLPAFVLIPAGIGIAVPAMTAAVLSDVPKEWAATASGALNMARQAGGAVGVAAFGALVANGTQRIVAGMHTAGYIAATMLIAVAGLTGTLRGHTAR